MLSPAQTILNISQSSDSKAKSSLCSIIILAIFAGACIALGDIFWAHSTIGVSSPGIANFLGGIAFSVGLLLVVFFGGHLFTSSVLSGVSTFENKLPFSTMLKYWIIVWIFNFVGSVFIAFMYFYSGLPFKYDSAILNMFIQLGGDKTSLEFIPLFIRGIFCNFFVCMAVWCATSSQNEAGKFLCIALIIAAFVATGYEHSVANMFIISEALIAKAHYLSSGMSLNELSNMLNSYPIEKLNNLSTFGFLITNLIPVTLGNIVGGTFFVGIIGFVAHKKNIEKIKEQQ